MQRLFSLLSALMLIGVLCLALPVGAQSTGVSVTCDNGTSFDNGVEVSIVQMRSGFEYTATVIGLNGFDPVLAVLDNATRTGLCTDDDSIAARYSANLPTTGPVPASGLSSQVRFSQNSASAFADVSLVVGGYGNTSGEFLLILEGMGVTSGDGAGDPFAVQITENLLNSGVPLTAYQISRTNQLDTLMYQIDGDYNQVNDSANSPVLCDDAGNAQTCWGTSYSLVGSSITTNQGQLGGNQYDSMLTIPLDSGMLNGFINFAMTSYNQQTQGQYVVVFHMGNSSDGKGELPVQPAQNPTQVPPPVNNSGLPAGITVTCDNGTSFNNGVEIVVNQMRSGFNYTATAIGLNGFDPVLAVLDTNSNNGLCTDDDSVAARYTANLPTTGLVPASNLSSQVRFSQNSAAAFADVSLVVGGYGNTSGEFLLILEGMAVTSGDGAGDPFSVRLTPGMVESGVPLSVYMISRTTDLDAAMAEIDADFNVRLDNGGSPIYCDDAGNAQTCWGTSYDLSTSSITTEQGQLPGYGRDSMLSLPLTGTQLNSNTDLNFINLLFTSYNQQTLGQYVLVFHVGTTTNVRPNA